VTRTQIGLIGCGNVATIIVRAAAEGRLDAGIGALFDIDHGRARRLAEIAGRPGVEKKTFAEFLSTPVDLVVEAASADAVRSYAEAVVSSGRDMVILSVGALMDRDLRERLKAASRATGSRVILPSGAIGGLDVLKAASTAGLEEVVLTTTKNPKSLPGDTPITEKTLLFEGDAEEAVKRFPRNINVAASVALASEANVTVRIVADPKVRANTHQLKARGAFGEMTLTISNVPSPDNPRTSYLAALSVIRTIQGMQDQLLVGT